MLVLSDLAQSAKLFLYSCSVACVGFSSTLLGQSRPDSARTFSAPQVLVTGVRLSGEAMSVPMALSIRSAESFSRDRIAGVDAALGMIPGVVVNSRAGAGDVRLNIRGFGARGSGDRSNAATVRGVKVLLDGIPETEPDGRTTFDLVDVGTIARVEVLRTNASMLFGNASGGLVNFSTARSFDHPYLNISTSLGAFGFRRTSLETGTTLPSSSLQASFSYGLFDGWRANSNSRQRQAALSFTAHLGDATTLRVVSGAAASSFSIPGALTQAQIDANPSQANAIYLARRERRENLVGRLAFDLTTEFLQDQTVSVIGYVTPKVLQRSERNTFRDFNRYHLGGGVVYLWKPVDGMLVRGVSLGVDGAYQDGAILFYNLVNGERGDSLRANKREGAGTWGAFAKTELSFQDDWVLTVGVRFDHQQYLAEDFAAGVKKSVLHDELNLSHLTPSIALLYRANENLSLYASVSGGLEAPAFNEVDPPPGVSNPLLNLVLKPMASTTYEAGVKGWWEAGGPLLRHVAYSAAAFAIRVSDEIVPYNGGAYYFSAGVSHRNGFEGSLDTQFRWGFEWQSALTAMNGEYDSYTNDLGNFSGNAAPGVPNLIWNNRVRWESTFGLGTELACNFTDSYVADDANVFVVPPATVINVAASYEFQVGNFSFVATAGIQNLADVEYAASAFINPVAGAFLEPGLPRNTYAGLRLKTSL